MKNNIRVGEYQYAIDTDGYVTCDGVGELGHFEDCEFIAGALHDLFDHLNEDDLK